MTPPLDGPETAAWPSVAVVVPAFNEERWLSTTLDAVLSAAYPQDRVEVVVVDNGSTDSTVALAQARGVRVLTSPGVTVAGLRNLGVATTRGVVLAFLDADCVPDRHWLTAAVTSLRAERCVTGARVLIPSNASWVERVWFDTPSEGRRRVGYINSGNLVVERELFDLVGGFDPTLVTGEDSEFCRRAVRLVPVIADDRIRVTHMGNPRTARQFVNREMWHGLGGAERSALTLRNRPLIGAGLWTTFTLCQLAGLAVGSTAGLSAVAAGGIGLLVLTGISAVRRVGTRSMKRVAQASALFYLYYCGRAIAAARVALGLSRTRRQRDG